MELSTVYCIIPYISSSYNYCFHDILYSMDLTLTKYIVFYSRLFDQQS